MRANPPRKRGRKSAEPEKRDSDSRIKNSNDVKELAESSPAGEKRDSDSRNGGILLSAEHLRQLRSVHGKITDDEYDAIKRRSLEEQVPLTGEILRKWSRKDAVVVKIGRSDNEKFRSRVRSLLNDVRKSDDAERYANAIDLLEKTSEAFDLAG